MLALHGAWALVLWTAFVQGCAPVRLAPSKAPATPGSRSSGQSREIHPSCRNPEPSAVALPRHLEADHAAAFPARALLTSFGRIRVGEQLVDVGPRQSENVLPLEVVVFDKSEHPGIVYEHSSIGMRLAVHVELGDLAPVTTRWIPLRQEGVHEEAVELGPLARVELLQEDANRARVRSVDCPIAVEGWLPRGVLGVSAVPERDGEAVEPDAYTEPDAQIMATPNGRVIGTANGSTAVPLTVEARTRSGLKVRYDGPRCRVRGFVAAEETSRDEWDSNCRSLPGWHGRGWPADTRAASLPVGTVLSTAPGGASPVAVTVAALEVRVPVQPCRREVQVWTPWGEVWLYAAAPHTRGEPSP